MSTDIFEALELLNKEKGIPAELILESLKNAITVACKKYYNVPDDNIGVEIDFATTKFKVYIIKEIVEVVENPAIQISLEDAIVKNKRAKLGSTINIKLDTKQIGRIAALSGKNLIHQAISEAVKNQLTSKYQEKLHEIIPAKVIKVEPDTGNATVLFNKNEVMLFKNEQLPNESLKEGDNIKVFVSDVIATEKRCIIKITRLHRNLVKRLFETEVPEICDGIVEIMAISREPGFRTKMAVSSNDDNVDPVGACIGQKGSRVEAIVDELCGEKIDIVKYSTDPATFIAAALAPADVINVEIINETERQCRVTVPNDQLSLAIGNKGQNAKLAAKLTNFKIDIKPETGSIEVAQ